MPAENLSTFSLRPNSDKDLAQAASNPRHPGGACSCNPRNLYEGGRSSSSYAGTSGRSFPCASAAGMAHRDRLPDETGSKS